MKKKSVSMLLAAIMVVSLFAGCGTKSDSKADTTKEEIQTKTTVDAADNENTDKTLDSICCKESESGYGRTDREVPGNTSNCKGAGKL